LGIIWRPFSFGNGRVAAIYFLFVLVQLSPFSSVSVQLSPFCFGSAAVAAILLIVNASSVIGKEQINLLAEW